MLILFCSFEEKRRAFSFWKICNFKTALFSINMVKVELMLNTVYANI